jgi:hypothetical protein
MRLYNLNLGYIICDLIFITRVDKNWYWRSFLGKKVEEFVFLLFVYFFLRKKEAETFRYIHIDLCA